jgi:ABC-type branched-subunit amino acid transport system substrate-binding protein
MIDRANQVLSTQRWLRVLAIIIPCVLVTSIASVGQVQHELDQAAAERQRVQTGGLPGVGPGTSTPGDTSPDGDTSTTLPFGVTTTVAAGTPGATGATGGTTAVPRTGSTPTPTIAPGAIPDFGLRTQGVTDREVKVGYSYNVAACGDAGTLSALLGSATTGSPKKAIDAFSRHINETGGIHGRTYKVDVVDDGGDGCPEKNTAAAVRMADEDKVFLAIPGLHVVSDYVISKHIPVFGGRDDPDSLAKIGANGIMITEPLGPTFDAWASFGRHYLATADHVPCLIRPESGASGDWNSYEKILVNALKAQGLKFHDIVTYEEDVSTAQQQANTAVIRMKSKGCDQVWLLAGNPIAWIFFTQAATQGQWFPQWTFTSYTVLADSELAGRLMDQRQWQNAVGLSSRIPKGQHPREGNCKRIYEKYYPSDGQSESAATQIACAQLLSTAEIMRRAVDRTGVLTANSLLVGADAVQNNFYYDAHVPITWSFPSARGPFKTKGFSHYTVAKWDSRASEYVFPEYPKYWRVMGPGKSGSEDLRPFFKLTYPG